MKRGADYVIISVNENRAPERNVEELYLIEDTKERNYGRK